jgi:hypothetical protein
MGTAKKSKIPPAKQEPYEKLIATMPGIARKDDVYPYASRNGHAYTYLDHTGHAHATRRGRPRRLFEKNKRQHCSSHTASSKRTT